MNTAAPEVVLAAASGSTGGYGKVGTIAATTGTLLVLFRNVSEETDQSYAALDWRIRTDKACTVQLFRSRTVPTATITLADATAVDADDTFVLNAVTITAKESGAVASSGEYNVGADNEETAANLTALLNTGIVPGISAAVAAVDATDVITITMTEATVLQFAQDTSAANEIAWGAPATTGLVKDGSATTISASNAAYAGEIVPSGGSQWVSGWPYAWALITNSTGDAQTVTVAASPY